MLTCTRAASAAASTTAQREIQLPGGYTNVSEMNGHDPAGTRPCANMNARQTTSVPTNCASTTLAKFIAEIMNREGSAAAVVVIVVGAARSWMATVYALPLT